MKKQEQLHEEILREDPNVGGKTPKAELKNEIKVNRIFYIIGAVALILALILLLY